MNKRLVIVLCAILTAALLVGCSAAPAAAPTEAPSAAPSAAECPTADAAAAPESAQRTVWQPQFIPLASKDFLSGLQSGARQGESLYFISSGVIDDRTPEGVTPEWPEQYWVYGPILVKVATDGASEIVPYTPVLPERSPGVNTGVVFERLFASEDGFWIVENAYEIREEDEESREERTLVHLAEDGSVLARFPLAALSAIGEEAARSDGSYSFAVTGLACGDGENLCLSVHEWYSGSRGYVQSNRAFILNAQTGEIRHTIELEGSVEALVGLGNGAVAVASYRGAAPVISLVNVKTGDLTELTALDDFLTDVVGGEGDALYYGAGDSFYCLHTDTAESEKLFDWSACDVAHRDGDSVCVLSDGRIVTTVSREEADGVRCELVILSPVAESEMPQRKTLRLAVMNLYPFTSEMISRFNRSQSEIRIEVTDYARYNDYSSSDPEDWNAGLTRLQTELIAGDVPDLIDLSLLPVSRLGEKGLLEDLLPYIDADPELSREQLNMHVLEAFEENGKLYQTVSNYYVLTTLGLRDAVGGQMGWTMEDFSAAMQRLQAEHPESTVFDVYTTRDDALTFLLYLEMADFVDWSTGECSFDSPAFQELLSFVRSFPTAYDWGGDTTLMELDSDVRLATGLQLMKQCNLACFEDVQRNTLGLGGLPVTFVGYPTERGVGSMFAQIGNSIAISASCPEKAAAWEFVRQFFLPVFQEQLVGSVFPTNLSVYETMKQTARSTAYQRNPDGSFALDADGRRIEADRGSAVISGIPVPLRTVTEEEIALVEEIVAATTHILSVDESLKEILVSNAAPYFADQRSVEETVRQIQSRASIYVNEQR